MDRPGIASAYVAIGSNLGDRAALLDEAVARIGRIEGVRVTARSTVIETEPVGPPGQGPYLNGVIGVKTGLGPRRLLDALLEVERAMGRRRDDAPRWGPRTIDLDLLLYADAVVDEGGLTVPHPRMHERTFVLGPLAEIAPEAVHPVLRRTAAALLAEIEGRA